MSPPLLIADVPWLLYRSYFALPKSIGRRRAAGERAARNRERAARADRGATGRRARRGVVACTGAEQAAYRVQLYPPYHAHRPPMPPELAAQWERAPALLEASAGPCGRASELEADDVMFSFARDGGARPGPRAAADRPTATVRGGQRARRGGGAAQGGRAGRDRRGRGARALRRRPRAGRRTSSPCAAIPPTGFPARRGSARRRRPSCCARTGRWRRCSTRRRPEGAAAPIRSRRTAHASARRRDAARATPSCCAHSRRSRRCSGSR